jgi:hypothetical protein
MRARAAIAIIGFAVVPAHVTNASGTLSLADKGLTNANLTKGLPAP